MGSGFPYCGYWGGKGESSKVKGRRGSKVKGEMWGGGQAFLIVVIWRRRTGSRGRGAEDGGRRTEGRGRMTEGGGRRTEDG